ncbi:hypothetical protein PR048_020485 [Dryococelus australis]|uniref:Major facilitator superfamily (MFS) profile domain-containing protein n=1 Tax=Dryococelus australis TaxID=614101 RepID=A0ABQ9H6H0_9NEOP|nr:hypothetical protein PR048_020485 [Dryococelus australis]
MGCAGAASRQSPTALPSHKGILDDVLRHFDIQNAKGGLLQTAFVLSYMVFAPLFGYLGDRYSRRAIMAFGVFLWSLTTLIGSFMDSYNWFLIFRTLVGIGEASYSTIAPTIISDICVGDMRSRMLAMFYFAIPVGSGLGYIVGSETAKATGHWQWGLRVTPFVGFIAVVLIMCVMDDPERGESECSSHLKPTSWKEDIIQLCRNRTFMLSTAGFTCVAFVTGALAWWGPTFIYEGLRLQPGKADVQLSDVSYKFGIITMVSGIIGVPLGSFLAQVLRPRYQSVDPVICAFGLISSMPLLFCAMLFADKYGILCYFLVFFGELVLNLNWSIVADIVLVMFGLLAMLAGILGVPLGSFLSSSLRPKVLSVDGWICGIGLLISAPCLLGAAYFARYNAYFCCILIFVGELSLNLNWSIVADMLLAGAKPNSYSSNKSGVVVGEIGFPQSFQRSTMGVILGWTGLTPEPTTHSLQQLAWCGGLSAS